MPIHSLANRTGARSILFILIRKQDRKWLGFRICSRPFFRSIGPTGFGNPNVATQRNQTNRRDRRSQSKDKPHYFGASRTVLRTKCSQQKSPSSNEQFPDEKRNIR